MAYRKVDDTSLASVADAIRSKGGTSDTLEFPDGFATAISAIQTGGGGGGGIGVQSDWNQNDSAALDYIKNRPFYDVGHVIIEESAVPFTESHGLYGADIQSTLVHTAGETYKVYWDGTAYDFTNVDDVNVFIGNRSIIDNGPDTGEPFLITIDDLYIHIITADTSASHTVSIIGYNPSDAIKIPRKYLPKTAFITYNSNNSTYSSDFEFDELYEKLSYGENVILYIPDYREYQYLLQWSWASHDKINLLFNKRTLLLSIDGTIVNAGPS